MKPASLIRLVRTGTPAACILATAIAALLVASSAPAASDSWNVDAAGNWATVGSWLSGTQAPGSTTTDNADVATFNKTLTGSGKTVTVDTDRYIGGIDFWNTSGFGYTLGSGILHLNSGGVIQTLAGNGNHTDTISSAIVISGTSGATATFTAGATSANSLLKLGAVTGSATTGNTTTLTLNGTNTGANLISGIIGDGAGSGKLALIKSGAGNWVLSGANTYSGGTTLDLGGLTLSNSSALGSGALTINAGTLDSGGNISLATNNTQTWNGNFTFTGSQNLNLGTGAVSLGSTAGARTVTVNNNTLTVGGVISDGTATALTKAGGGVLTLAGANNYTGATTISGGTIKFNSLGAMAGSGRNVTVANGAVAAAGYAIDNTFLNRIAENSNSSIIALGADSSNNLDFNTSAGATLSGAYLGAVGTAAMGNGIYTYSGVLTPNGTTYRLGGGGGMLVMANNNALTGGGNSLTVNGNVVLAAGNNHGAGTTLTNGTLTLNDAGAIGSGTLTINGGTLNTSNGADVTLSTNNAQTWGNNFTYSGAFGPTKAASSLNLGTGTVTMTSARTVTVNNKTLTVGGTITGTSLNALDITKAGNGTLVLSAPVTLRSGQTNTINAGITQIDGKISGAFGFNKAGNGILSLTNSLNDFGPGTININAGTGLLSVTSDGALGNSGNIISLNTASTGLQFNLDGGGNGLAANSFAHQINTTTAGGVLAVTQYGATTPAVTNVATLTTAFNGGAASAIGFSKTNNGILNLNVDNTASYTGVISVNAGAIRASNAGALGAAANNTIVDSANKSGAAVQLNGTGTAETFTISNSGINTGGAIENFSGSNDLTGAITLAAAAAIGADTGTTLNIKGGISGAFGLTFNTIGTGSINIDTTAINANVTAITKLGSGTLTFDVDSSLVVAPITVNAGVLDIKAGVLGGTGLVSVAPGATLNLTGAATNRLGGRPLTLGGGILNASGNAAETTGAFTLNAGQSIINNTSTQILTLGAAAPAFVIANSARGATALFKGGSTINFGAAPTLTGAGANDSTTKGILPWALFDAGSGTGSSFATVDVTSGNLTTVRALGGSEYAATLATNTNVALTGSVAASAATTTTINSLTLNSGGGVTMSTASPATAATQLTVTSSGILSNATSSISGGVLSFGNGYIFTPGASESSNVLTISSAIIGTTLTKAGAGTLVLSSVSGAFPGYTANNFYGGGHDGGFFINEGTVQLGTAGTPVNNALYQYSNNDSNAITVNSGAKLDLNGSTQLVGPILSQGFGNNVMLNANTVAGGTITSATGYGNIIAITGNPGGNGQYGFTGSITGAHVGFAVGGQNTSAQMLLGANSYGGPTLVASVGTSAAIGLILKNDGTISNTSDITLNGGALVIDNTGLSNNNDRVRDAAAISMSGGYLYYLGRAQNASTETVGALTLVRGNNTITVTNGGTGVNSADLTLGGLSRTAGNSATAIFSNVTGAAGNNTGRINVLDPVTGNPATIASLTTAGVLVNGIIPWAVNGAEFMSYIPYATVNGVTSGGLGPMNATGFPATIGNLPTTDNPTGNYKLSNPIIGSSVTLNSLNLSGSGMTFAEPSLLLNLTSGGLFVGANSKSVGATVDSGRITAGGSATSGTADLYMYQTNNTFNLNARIVDNGLGAKTRLVVHGDNSVTIANSNNSYTGGTVMSGTGLNLTHASSGVVIPNAATPADGLILNNNTLTMSNSAGQIGSGNIVTLNSATLNLYGSNTLAGLTLNALGAASTVNTSPAGTLTLTGGITTTGTNVYGSTINCAVSLASGTTLNVGAATFNGQILNPLAADLTFGSTVTGGGGAMTKSGSGVVQFNGLATLNAGSLNVTGGGLQINVSNFNAGAVDLTLQNGSWLNLNGRNTTFGSLAAPGTGMVTNTSTTAATLTVGGTHADSVFAGSFKRFNDQAVNTINLTKVGNGTLTLTGTANTAFGVTTVSAGTLQFGKQLSLYNNTPAGWTASNIRVASGATLALNVGGSGEFTTGDVTTLLTNLGGLGGAPGSGLGLQAGSKIAFDTTNASAATFTVANNIANSTGGGGGAIGVTKLGTNTLELTGTNAYTGATTVKAGTLSVASTGTINGTGGVNIGAATFNYNSATALTKNVTFTSTGGTLSGSGTINQAVNVTTGNTLAPGNGVGKETFTNNLTFGSTSGSILEWELASTPNETVIADNSNYASNRGTDYDAVNVAGTLGGSGAVLRVVLNGGQDFSETFWNSDRTWSDIFRDGDGTGTGNVSFAAYFSSVEYYNSTNGNLGVPTSQGYFGMSGNTLSWYSAVPEPTSALAGLLLGAGLLRRRR